MSEDTDMRAGADPADTTPPPPEDLSTPMATETLLNALMAESLAQMRVAAHLYRTCPYEPVERGVFVHHSVDLMKAAAELAAMSARLRGGETRPEIRQRLTVERITRPALPGEPAQGEGEGGTPIPKND